MPDTTPRGRAARAIQENPEADSYATAEAVLEALRRTSNKDLRILLANWGIAAADMDRSIQLMMTCVLGKPRNAPK